MTQSRAIPDDVLQFIARRIDSVPHLEALLLLWKEPRQKWSDDLVSARIYVGRDRARSILSDLARHGLITANGGATTTYEYDWSWDEAKIMERISDAYQRHLVFLAGMIHSKSSSEAVQDFAKAFQINKKD